METRLLEACSIIDSDSLQDCVRITYQCDEPGLFNNTKTDWIYSKALGNWSTICFSPDEGVSVDGFLGAMVERNQDCLRKMCILLLKKIGTGYHNYMYLIPIIDPTFEPPRINHRSRWQRELAQDITSNTFQTVIMTCKNLNRLERLYYHLLHISKNHDNNKYY